MEGGALSAGLNKRHFYYYYYYYYYHYHVLKS